MFDLMCDCHRGAVPLSHRAEASSTGVITHMESVEVPGQNMVMVAINISMHNRSSKPSSFNRSRRRLMLAQYSFGR